MHTVKVFNNSGKIIPTHVEIDGKPLRCRSIDYHVDIDTVPTFTLGVAALSDVEVNHSDIRFRFAPQTVTDAVKILRHELTYDKELCAAFISSIESALQEAKPYTSEHDLAAAILRRVAGIE